MSAVYNSQPSACVSPDRDCPLTRRRLPRWGPASDFRHRNVCTKACVGKRATSIPHPFPVIKQTERRGNNRLSIGHCAGWHKPLTHAHARTPCVLGCSHGNAAPSSRVLAVCKVAAHRVSGMEQANLTSIRVMPSRNLSCFSCRCAWTGRRPWKSAPN